MERADLVIVAVATVAAGYLIAQFNAQQVGEGSDPSMPAPASSDDSSGLSVIDQAMSTIRNTLGLWRPPAQYAGAIAAAEAANGIPTDILARLLYQESRYREDIITGKTKSPAGALGIAQFMPATASEMGINPLDPFQAIDAAARYLARLYSQTGSWTAALAAYNWGIGNVQRKGLAAAPTETRNYWTQILADVNGADGTAIA